MKRSPILPVIILLIFSTGYGQGRQYRYYFDKDFNSAGKSQSVFTGIGVYDSGKFVLKLYNLNDELVLIEHYTDTTLRVNYGLTQSFYTNGKLQEEGNYLSGRQEGVWQRWDSAGRVIDSSVYRSGVKILEVHTGYNKSNFFDSLVVNDIAADRLTRTHYDAEGRVNSEVNFTGQKGVLKRYEKGVMVSTDSVWTRAEIEASFPGGDDAWTRYIGKYIERHINALIKDDRSGTCRVRFIVDKEGNVKDAKAITMQGSALARVAINAIMKGPKWIPANQYGRAVNAYREQPVSFSIQ